MKLRTYHIIPSQDGWTVTLDGVDVASGLPTQEEALKVADLMAQDCPSALVRVLYADASLAGEYRYHGEPRHIRC